MTLVLGSSRLNASHLFFTVVTLMFMNSTGWSDGLYMACEWPIRQGADCRQNTIGSVKGELRNHEIREIQVDALLKLDRAAKNQTSNGSREVAPKGYFLSGPQAGISWPLPG